MSNDCTVVNDRACIVFLGLSITSSWGNGHATTYRGLVKELAALGHQVHFLERDMPWYAAHREFDTLPGCSIHLYRSLDELKEQHCALIENADLAVVGSYVPEGIAVGEWMTATCRGVRAFYDIDTPVTLAHLKQDRCEYLSRELCPRFDLYLSFTGGPTLEFIERKFGAPRARALYCSADPSIYYPESQPAQYDLGYLGTFASDRQPALQRLMLQTAADEPDRRFCVAGPQYPAEITWPSNVLRIEHLPASGHRAFYNSQRFTLNLTRQDMVRAGYSPSVRLFEAAACGTPILTDYWPGLETIFTLGSEILIAQSSSDVRGALKMPREERMRIAQRARTRVLASHTASVRARELLNHLTATRDARALSKRQRRLAARSFGQPAVL